MKQIKAYIRIAKNNKKGYKLAISTKPNPATLNKLDTYNRQIPLPTIRFGVTINLPDDVFDFSQVIENEIQLNISNKEIN